MRIMRSHNLAYFRWFLEHKKIPPAHRCTNGISCLFRQYKMRVMRPHKKTHGLRTSQRKDTKNIPICVSKKQPLTKLQHLAVINYSINLLFTPYSTK